MTMYFMGLDIGTTGSKALVVDKKGVTIGKGYAGYQLISNGNKVEQNATDWSRCAGIAIRAAIEGLDASKIAAISLSTQGASMVALDANNNPLGHALTWMDSRATNETEELVERLGGEYIYRGTGWRANPSLDAAKMMYMKRSNDYLDAVSYVSTLEFMNIFLTGKSIVDPTNALLRQVYNLRFNDYDDEILKVIDIKRDELPEVSPTGTLVGHLTESAATATGLRVGTPVYNGAHDQTCASLGAGASEKGDILLSAGTTWVILGINDGPMFTDTFIAPAPHPIPGLYGHIASLVGSGSSLEWFKNNFMDDSFDEINLEVPSRTQKTKDLFYYPYLSGAGYPIWIPEAKGIFAGIALEHDKYDFARAIMDSSAFGVKWALDDFYANGFEFNTLLIMGGAAKSDFWCQLIASSINQEVCVSNENEACALGAAIIAATGTGAFASLNEAVKEMSAETRTISPNADLIVTIKEKMEKYEKMWSCVASYYEQ